MATESTVLGSMRLTLLLTQTLTRKNTSSIGGRDLEEGRKGDSDGDGA